MAGSMSLILAQHATFYSETVRAGKYGLSLLFRIPHSQFRILESSFGIDNSRRGGINFETADFSRCPVSLFSLGGEKKANESACVES
jgi:hypothetical protein